MLTGADPSNSPRAHADFANGGETQALLPARSLGVAVPMLADGPDDAVMSPRTHRTGEGVAFDLIERRQRARRTSVVASGMDPATIAARRRRASFVMMNGGGPVDTGVTLEGQLGLLIQGANTSMPPLHLEDLPELDVQTLAFGASPSLHSRRVSMRSAPGLQEGRVAQGRPSGNPSFAAAADMDSMVAQIMMQGTQGGAPRTAAGQPPPVQAGVGGGGAVGPARGASPVSMGGLGAERGGIGKGSGRSSPVAAGGGGAAAGGAGGGGARSMLGSRGATRDAATLSLPSLADAVSATVRGWV
jgi:hypothetical protein